ncbi:phage holin family protein [Quadrisphaera sp. DSM 44207]|uniref:phage holin family protein n=1 Tax=Quadrisphaera sp. DSM 44207 TaxID=1881057 RepID=UPI00088FD48B|nr:phage holin family protein [Quadrisphaera sp. DSM 44207]SDQ17912.1 Putative Holin-X, holin superfamily III [Quadrisphaera sp. DSM 44207]
MSHPQGTTGRTTSHPLGTTQGAAGHGGGQERTIGQLVVDATRDLSQLLRAEVALAKAEIAKEAKQGAIGASLFIAAAVFGFLGLIFVLLTIAWALALVMPTWLAFLIVAVLLLVVAGVLALIGRGRVKQVGPPVRTIETSKRSVEALKGRH